MKKFIFLSSICFCMTSLFSGSLRLHNDSPYKLRCVVRGADGTYLGEMVVLPGHTNTWSSEYPSFGPGGQFYMESPSRSMTPYTVYWYCPDGGEYGIATNIPSGMAVFAESASGRKYCKPPSKKKKASPYGPKEGEEVLGGQEEEQSE